MEEITLFLKNNFWIVPLVIIWNLSWKGVALWKAAQYGQKIWFIVLFVVNTLAILDIFYIFALNKSRGKTADSESSLS